MKDLYNENYKTSMNEIEENSGIQQSKILYAHMLREATLFKCSYDSQIQ